VLLKDIRFESHCEHHMAPIIGRAHVAYLPDRRVVGISKLARLVDIYAKRLQIQEKMTAQIANTLQRGAAAARRRRGDRGRAPMHDHARRAQAGCRMVTSRMLGAFRDDATTRREFLAMLNTPSHAANV
jgi:GTP cyclohydrolase I